MDEVCTCVACKSQSWIISRDYVRCTKCGREYHVLVVAQGDNLIDIINNQYQLLPEPTSFISAGNAKTCEAG